MSVQAGIWNFDGAPVLPDVLDRFAELTAEYAPDDQRVFSANFIAFLFRAFYTTHESRIKVQPYVSRHGRIHTWDGRLDNREELADLLHMKSSDGLADIAIVAAGFDQWGTECFAKLKGDWAMAVWSTRERELVLARDYIGVKPLFYFPRATQLMWCSHLAPLALCGAQFTVCEQYLAGYFAFHPDASLTPYGEIRSVPPGGFARIVNGKITTHAYWKFDSHRRTHYRADSDYEEHYRLLLRQAVRRRLRTDSPALAELSGGLDSSSIVCVADDLLARGEANAPQLDTLSYYDSNEPGEDDFCHFDAVEEQRGRKGIRVDLKGCGDSLSLEDAAFCAVPGFRCRAEIKEAISAVAKGDRHRIMLCGMGGDEMNGQSLDPRVQIADQLARLRFREFAELLMAWSICMRQPLIQIFFQSVARLLPSAIFARLAKRGQPEPWIRSSFARKFRMSARQVEAMDDTWFTRPAARDAMQTLATLARQLTNAAPSLLEPRYPFLDQDLVEFLTTIPLEQLLRPGQRRSLMRRALKDLLPPAIAVRKTKTSAGRCYAITLEKHWEEIEALLDSPLVASLGYVERDAMKTALAAMKCGRLPSSFLRLLKALSLELWLRNASTRGVLSLVVPPSIREPGAKRLLEYAPRLKEFDTCC